MATRHGRADWRMHRRHRPAAYRAGDLPASRALAAAGGSDPVCRQRPHLALAEPAGAGQERERFAALTASDLHRDGIGLLLYWLLRSRGGISDHVAAGPVR